MKVKETWEKIVWFIKGMAVVMSFEEDPELWDNPRKKARIRRRMEKERSVHGKKADV